MSATGAVTPGANVARENTTAGLIFGSSSRNSPRSTPKRNKPVMNIAEASVASIAGISAKAISQPLMRPTASHGQHARAERQRPGKAGVDREC